MDDLYREIILEHYAHPRCKGKLEHATHRQDGVNPTCGDAVTLELDVCSGCVHKAGFEGVGCSICLASASMLTDLIEGKTLDEVRALTDQFKKRMLNRHDATPCPEELGELEALDGVRQYPVRVKCALLAWNTMLGALEEVQ